MALSLPENLPRWAPFAAVGAGAGILVLIRKGASAAPASVTSQPAPPAAPPTVTLPDGAMAGGGAVSPDYNAVIATAVGGVTSQLEAELAASQQASQDQIGKLTDLINSIISKGETTNPSGGSPSPVQGQRGPLPPWVGGNTIPVPSVPSAPQPGSGTGGMYTPPAPSPLAPTPPPQPVQPTVKGPAYVADGFLFPSGETLPTYAFTAITTRRHTVVQLPSMYEPWNDTHQYMNSGHPESAIGKVARMLSDLEEGGHVWSGQPNNNPQDARNVYGVMRVVIGEAGGQHTGFVHADRFV